MVLIMKIKYHQLQVVSIGLLISNIISQLHVFIGFFPFLYLIPVEA